MLDQIYDFIRLNELNLYQIALQDKDGMKAIKCQPCNDCNLVYSITKVFTNAAVGILIDDKKLHIEDSLLSYLQSYIDFSYASVWNSVTIRHALSHRMGLDEGVVDIDRDDIRSYGTANHLKYILQYPPKFPAGSYRKYTDCAHYLLSLLVEQITGMPADIFIQQKILQPLQFQHTAWTRCPLQHTIGATGAYMRAEDMVKFGWLFVKNGTFHDNQIVSGNWIQEMEQNKYDIYPVKGTSFYHKGGMNGQMLLYSREKQIALAWTGYEDDRKMQLLTEYIPKLYGDV